MNIRFRSAVPARRLPARNARALLIAFVATLGGNASAATAVDQQPLTVQAQIPPNVTLMFDDSGSMDWDYMPDACFLQNVDCGGGTSTVQSVNNDAMLDATNNEIYYDPTVTYTPPVRADGTAYPYYSSIAAAPENGFDASSTQDDLTNFSTSDIQGENQRTGRAFYYSFSKSGPRGSTLRYFQYSTGPAAGPYVLHYVATAAQGCGGQANCVLDSDTSGVAAPTGVTVGRNVATWFAYYHTRMLMAKTGLMMAFSGVSSNFRIGFGSIDGNNDGGLPSLQATLGSNVIAEVQPFGTGASGTHKANFWNWVAGLTPNNGTPLRSALDAVGSYYMSDQAWSTMSSDPATVPANTEVACRQAYAILTTDGFWNSSYSGSGNVDGVDGTTVTGPDGQSYKYKALPPYSDSNSNTLADVAMKYWRTDLRAAANEVPPSTEDAAFWQHMTTFTIGLGFSPTGITPAGTTMPQIFNWANGGTPISGFAWPTPAANSINNIADLAHAAVNGHGGFYSATNPQEFAGGLSDALKRASERVGTGASLAANSTSLATGTVVYLANYYTGKWKGDLKALAVNAATGEISTAPTWSAAAALPTAANRLIWTYVPSTGAFIQFKNAGASPPALSSAELAALGADAASQTKLVAYLRGDATEEQRNGGTLRSRDTPLGDIVDSQPVYSGAPNPNQFINQSFTGYAADASGASPFHTWAMAQASRTPYVFIAANDGMLHAFAASNGAEGFAYLPGAVITANLRNLADPGYGGGLAPHQYYDDGELTIADAYLNSAWHTVLVGTTGRGLARAVYALDITDPAGIVPLWERSAADGNSGSDYIGEMVGKPVIAQVADGSWAVLIGNGYNSTQNVSALLQFDLGNGTLSVHRTTDSTANNGLAAPVAWMNTPTSGIADVAYAGDLRGQVWSFQLDSGSSSTGSLLFTAQDARGKAQPITAGMLAGKNPKDNNVWLYFGTGEYLNQADITNLDVQTWYGIIVQASSRNIVNNLGNGRSALKQRSILAETTGDPLANPPVLPARAVTSAPSSPDMNGKSGWYLDLTSPTGARGAAVAQGERIVVPNQFQGNLLIGTTRIPQVTDVCNPSGRGWILAIDPFTGTAPTSNFFDTNGDNHVDSGDTITLPDGTHVPAAGVGFGALPNAPIFVGGIMEVSFDNGTTASLKTAGSGGGLTRVSWQEIVSP